MVIATSLTLHFFESFKQYSVNSLLLILGHGGWIALAESYSSYLHEQSSVLSLLHKDFIVPKLTLHLNPARPSPVPLCREIFLATLKLSVKYTPGPRRLLLLGCKPAEAIPLILDNLLPWYSLFPIGQSCEKCFEFLHPHDRQ